MIRYLLILFTGASMLLCISFAWSNTAPSVPQEQGQEQKAQQKAQPTKQKAQPNVLMEIVKTGRARIPGQMAANMLVNGKIVTVAGMAL